MIKLQKHHIEEALHKIKTGLDKYQRLQTEVRNSNVKNNRDFQRRFNAFYRVRRNKVWQEVFYNLLESNKNRSVTFEDILNNLYQKTHRVEASFASKLVGTINPEMPIIDKVVYSNLGLKLPHAKTENRQKVICVQYESLRQEFLTFLKTENGKYLVRRFSNEYPKAKITEVKMLDLVLWQTRA
jgi:hypothetical protein